MKLDQIAELLALVEGYERITVPKAAYDVWYAELAHTEFVDAKAAVEKHYRMNPVDSYGNVRKIMPMDVRRISEDFRNTRLRALARKALAAAEPEPGQRGAEPTRRGLTARERARAIAAEAGERARAQRSSLVAA